MSILFFVGLAVCVVAGISDFRTGTIPNALTYPVLLLAPPAHFALALRNGLSLADAGAHAGLSVVGLLLCGLVPLLMWRSGALGGGDVKLFAALGGLVLPRFGFEAEAYVFLSATLIAPLQLLHQGKLLVLLANVAARLRNALRPKERRVPTDSNIATWFRLGPCFAIGFAVEIASHWTSNW